MISKLINTRLGSIIFSVILGLGLAALFRQVCNGQDCLIINGPKFDDIKKYFYKNVN